MFVEIIITAVIFIAAGYLLFRNIRHSASGKCSGCRSGKESGDSCCSHCKEN